MHMTPSFEVKDSLLDSAWPSLRLKQRSTGHMVLKRTTVGEICREHFVSKEKYLPVLLYLVGEFT